MAKSAERFALLRLYETKPTTLNGLAALSDYVAEIYADHIDDIGNTESEIIFRTIREAAKSMRATVAERGSAGAVRLYVKAHRFQWALLRSVPDVA